MTRARHGKPKPQRICLMCGSGISEDRPVFLVAHQSGRIVGPYHAGCAEKFLILADRREAPMDQVLGPQYGTWPSRREETMPW